MDARTENRWAAALRELVIIVAGVLIALAANAWVESRGERTREREYVEQLKADMTATLTALDSAFRQEAGSKTALDSLLVVMTSDRPINTDSVRVWSMAMGGYSDPRVVLGTVSALLQTGDLRLIRDRDVRVAVSAYASSVTGDLAEFSRFVDLSITANDPMMNRVVRSGLFVPSDAAAGLRSFIALRRDPVMSTFYITEGLAAENRRLYVDHMRTETKKLLDVVKRYDASPKVAVTRAR